MMLTEPRPLELGEFDLHGVARLKAGLNLWSGALKLVRPDGCHGLPLMKICAGS